MVEKYTGKGKKAEHIADYHGKEPPVKPGSKPAILEYHGKEPPVYHGKEPSVKPGSKPAIPEYHGKEPPRKKK